jgi:uncharacterized RDD family membrane protein YckC
MPSGPELALDLTVPLESSGVQATAHAPTPLDGQSKLRIDHFVVDRKIGSGGMGAIYAARDVALDRPVAIKVLPVDLAKEPGAHERFIREAQAQARLNSPHVVQIFFIGRLPPDIGGGSLYFAMELVDGESLEAPLSRGERLDPELARRLMIQAARGLDDAHQAGLVHRDVKPANLLVDRAEHLKIADFGLAKPRDPNLSLTKDGAVMGTPFYMAPEQALGEPVDQRTDMYALGCTFYHLVAGEPPFDGPSTVAVISHHLKTPPRPLRSLRPTVPPALAQIIDRLLSKAAADRFASYEELIAALEAAAPTRLEYAGFWTRAAAVAMDGLLLSLLIGALGWPGLVIHLIYVAVGHAYFGQTASKFVLRIRVERLDGTRLGLPRSIARAVAAMWLAFWVGFLTVWTQGLATLQGSVAQLARLDAARAFIVPIVVGNAVLAILYACGVALAAIHPQKRAVHDLLVGSRVVYRLGDHRLSLLPAAAKKP